jgi:prepilin-type N-terminal cleavage/methylation domain-containing protein
MSRFFKKQGFTLIELMVVIVIIGVLASLAIPRFTEASSKAKAAEAPRVIASFESAYLALAAESGEVTTTEGLIFEATALNSESKWWNYSQPTVNGTFSAVASATIGKIPKGSSLVTGYSAQTGVFTHATGGVADGGALKKYLPNYFRN